MVIPGKTLKMLFRFSYFTCDLYKFYCNERKKTGCLIGLISLHLSENFKRNQYVIKSFNVPLQMTRCEGVESVTQFRSLSPSLIKSIYYSPNSVDQWSCHWCRNLGKKSLYQSSSSPFSQLPEPRQSSYGCTPFFFFFFLSIPSQALQLMQVSSSHAEDEVCELTPRHSTRQEVAATQGTTSQ